MADACPVWCPMRETSETQSKPSYFRGQCWGAVGVLVGSLSACFCLPLQLQNPSRFLPYWSRSTGWRQRHSQHGLQRLVLMAVDFSVRYDRPSILVLDAFFPVASVFRLARIGSIQSRSNNPSVPRRKVKAFHAVLKMRVGLSVSVTRSWNQTAPCGLCKEQWS